MTTVVLTALLVCTGLCLAEKAGRVYAPGGIEAKDTAHTGHVGQASLGRELDHTVQPTASSEQPRPPQETCTYDDPAATSGAPQSCRRRSPRAKRAASNKAASMLKAASLLKAALEKAAVEHADHIEQNLQNTDGADAAVHSVLHVLAGTTPRELHGPMPLPPLPPLPTMPNVKNPDDKLHSPMPSALNWIQFLEAMLPPAPTTLARNLYDTIASSLYNEWTHLMTPRLNDSLTVDEQWRGINMF
jgi:hypothetical protein